MAAVKILAEKGADLDSPQPRAKIPSSEAYMPRNESYQTRNLSRDYTRQDSSATMLADKSPATETTQLADSSRTEAGPILQIDEEEES